MILLYSLYELLRELTRILDLRTTHKISTPIALVLSDWTPRTTFLVPSNACLPYDSSDPFSPV